MSGFDKLNVVTQRQYIVLNPWTVRFTPEADATRTVMEGDPGDRAVLARVLHELRIFPPAEQWYSLASDITGSNVSVRVHMESGRRFELAAEYRLIAEECAVFWLSVGGSDAGAKSPPRRLS